MVCAVQPDKIGYYDNFIGLVKTHVHSPSDVKTEKEPESFLNLKVTRLSDGGILLNQPVFTDKILQVANMEKSKPLNTFNPTGMMEFTKDDCPKNAKEKQEMEKYPMRTAVGCLLYLSLMTRPVITKAVSAASSIVSNPGKAHWKNVQHIIRYINGTRDHGIIYRPGSSMEIRSSVDADWAGCKATRKSTSGWVIFLAGGPVLWKSSKQSIIARSVFESELTALYSHLGDVQWMRDLMEFWGFKQKPTIVDIDNEDVYRRCQELKLTQLNRHIGIRYSSVCEMYDAGVFEPNKVASEDNAADGLTKILPTKLMDRTQRQLQNYDIGN